jgi:hypothetical protein
MNMAEDHPQNTRRGAQRDTRTLDETPLQPDLDPLGPHQSFSGYGEVSDAQPPRYFGSAPGFGSRGMGYGPAGDGWAFGAFGVPHAVAADYLAASRAHGPRAFDAPHGRVGYGWEGAFGSEGEFSSFTDPAWPAHETQPRGDRVSQIGSANAQADAPRRGPRNYERSDERIHEEIHERLTHALHIDVHDVTVEVKAAKVTLYGTVPHRVMKHAIEDIVAACPGVKDIENKLTVALIAPWPQSGRKQE